MNEPTQAEPASTPTEAPEAPEVVAYVEPPVKADEYEQAPGEEHEAAANPEWVQDKREQEDDAKDAAKHNLANFDWETSPRPPFILSFVESDHPSGGFVIGWDTCGACMMHLRTCKCKNGPEQPKYVKNWRPAADTDHDKPSRISTAVRKAIVAADPQVVEKAVDEAVGGPDAGYTADGTLVRSRKRRADAGVPRGPRKKADATPDSVAEAAGDLSAALTKE